MSEAMLKIRGLSKSFYKNRVLNNVDIDFYPGEVHVLLGENGAGKSTILKLIMGQFRPDEGQMLYKGKPICFSSPFEARSSGIAMVYQELTLLPDMSVFDNVFLGRELCVSGIISKKEMLGRYLAVCEEYGIKMERDTLVKNLPLSKQLMVEVLKALITDPEVILFDEATSALDSDEVEHLFQIIRKLKNKGKTIVFISHRMEELFVIGDLVSVLKDGEMVATKRIDEVDQNRLIEMMVGRSISDIFPNKSAATGETMLEIEHVGTQDGSLKDVSMRIHRGEIVGVAGLKGHGQDVLLDCIAGVRKYNTGIIKLGGAALSQRGIQSAIRSGIILVPEDRKTQGLFLNHSIARNLCISSEYARQSMGVINRKLEAGFVSRMIDHIAIRCESPLDRVSQLSGGNQQKVVLGRVLGVEPRVILFNEPTRGIDVKTKQEVYRRLRALADEGVCVVVSSSDLLEIIGVSDTVYTMYEGAITRRLSGADINEVEIMKGAIGAVGA